MKPHDWACINNNARVWQVTADTASAALKRAARVVRSHENGELYEVDLKMVFDADEERWVMTLYLVD